MDYITIHQWLAVNKETRAKLRQIFFIPSTGMVEVVTDEFGKSHIKQDGHTNVDLQVITVERLRDYLGTAAINETIYDLWKQVVEKVETPVTDEQIKDAVDILKSEKILQEGNPIVVIDQKGNIPMITVKTPRKCDNCHFVTGSARGMKIHQAKHNKVKGV